MTRARGTVVAAVALAAVAATLLALGLWRQQPAPPQAPRSGPEAPVSSPAPPRGPSSTRRDAGKAPALPASEPARLTIPALDVSSSLVRLGRQENGVMETPTDPDEAGWYAPGPTPGERGPSVIAGHVTWNGDASVFFRLGELTSGDRVRVLREDGRTASFEVTRTERYRKSDFPTIRVYRNTDHAALRLITCGGDYDEESRRYSDNVVVFAELVGRNS